MGDFFSNKYFVGSYFTKRYWTYRVVVPEIVLPRVKFGVIERMPSSRRVSSTANNSSVYSTSRPITSVVNDLSSWKVDIVDSLTSIAKVDANTRIVNRDVSPSIATRILVANSDNVIRVTNANSIRVNETRENDVRLDK